MSDLICRKTMMRCQTAGMCSPHGGCQDPVTQQLRAVNFDYEIGKKAADSEIAKLKAEVEALRQQVADLSPFKGAPLRGPDTRCLACGGYHYGLGNLPCPKMRAIACAETYMANQRIVPVEPMIAGPHPLDAAMSKEAGHD